MLYFLANGPAPTTAAQAAVTTGTAIKTMLQVKLNGSAKNTGKVVQWHISFDGSAAATPIKCELLTTGAVGAQITEFLAADIINLDPNAPAVTDDNPFAFGVGGDESGYTSNGTEGTITATRMLDVAFVAPTNERTIQWPLGREPQFAPADFLRVRVTAGAAVNCYTYLVIEI